MRKRRIGGFRYFIATGGVLLQLAGCAPSLRSELAAFVHDLSREALAAFLF